MKKLLFFAAFALASLAASSAKAQSTISPVPGGKDTPHETQPSNIPSEDPYGKMRSPDQRLPGKRNQDGTMRSGQRMGKGKMKNKTMPATGTM